MTDIRSFYADVAACSNLRWDEAEGRYVIAIPEKANIAADTIGRHAQGAARDKIALIYEHEDGCVEELSFADLDTRANRLAVALRRLGVG